MEKVFKVAIVDDNPAFLQGLETLLFQYPQFEVVAKFPSGIELLTYKSINTLDLILIDIEMPELDGFETAKRICAENKCMNIIAMSMYDDKAYIGRMKISGFKGFVSKVRVVIELNEVLSKVMNNEVAFHH